MSVKPSMDGDPTTAVPMPEHPSAEEIFPNIQPKPPLVQLETILSNPVTCCLGEEANSHLATISCQGAVE